MTDKEKKNKIADILLDFYDEYNSNEINRPMIPSIYAGKILDLLKEEEPVSEELEEAANAYISNENNYSHSRTDTFKAGAEWQKKQDKDTVEIAREEMIDKAIGWIEEINNHHHIMRYSDSCEPPISELIEWFKNYMKEKGRDE